MSISIGLTAYDKDTDDIRKIRQAVFVEEQGIEPRLEWDDLDASASFIIARHQTSGAIGTARFFIDGKVGRMAVLQKWRGQGVGQAILSEIIQQARKSGIQRLHLSAQQSAIGFYEKNGFECHGPAYLEAGILHQAMFFVP